MNANISDTFAQLLQQMRSDVIAQIQAQRGGNIGRAQAAPDLRDIQSGDWSQVDGERDLAMAIDEHETVLLGAIETALQRIQTGAYGLCLDCGIDIPIARLHASPTALRCVHCQGQAEQARGGVAHPSL